MAQKSNIRSMRFSDKMIEMIESQAGETFTAKFEALVTRCMWELPKKEEELKLIQERINAERQRLTRIQKKGQEIEQNMLRLSQEMSTANARIKLLNNNFKKMIDEV